MPTITEEQLDEAFRFSQAYPDDPQVQEKADRVREAYSTQEVERQKALRSMYQDRERHGWDDETYNRVSSALSTRPQGKFEVINERFFANTYGLSSDQVRTMQKDLLEAYSTKTWGEPVTDDRAFYDRMGEEMDREDEVFNKGQQLALDGASGFEADAAFDFEYAADPKLKARADTLREQFRKAYDKTSNDISSLGVSVDDYVEELQISMGVKEEKGREPLPDSWFIENVLNMPPDKRDVFLSAVAARSGEGEEKSLLRASLEGLGRQATTMGRSIGNFERINLLSTLRDSVASGRISSEDLPEEYGFDPKVPLAQAFNPAKGFDALKSAPKQGTPEFQALSEDQQNALVRIDKELEYITLYEKVNALAEGRIDPAKGSNWYTSGVIGASRMVPNIAMMASGPIGAILNIQNYAGQRATDFLIENPGSDPTDATRIGLATGLAQGLLDAIPTKIIQGKIPFLSSWLKKATLKRGGLFARGAVRLGVGTVFEAGQEFSQDVLAPGVVDEIAQVLKKDLPGANWDKRLEAFKSPETMSELIPSIVMLSLIGTGVGGIKDYRGGWMLASNRRLLIGAGIDPEAADAIVAAAKQQDATTTQTLLRESFEKIDAGPVLEVLPKAQKAAFASLAQEIEDKRTAVFNLEKAGVIPQVVPTKEGFEVTNPKGVKRTFATREEAQTARWEYVAEQEIEVHEDLARVIDRLDRGIRPDQRKERQLDPETKTLLDAKQEGQRTAEGAKARADKAAFLDDQGAPAPQQQAAPDAESDLDVDAEYKEAVDTAILSSLDEDDRLAGMLIIGESSTAYRDRVYRTTVKLRNRATWATVIEEDSEGDAATMIQKGKRDWLADKLFAFDSDFQQGRLIGGKKLSLFEDGVTRETATDEDLIEAYSRMAQYYFVGTMKKGRQDGFKASEGFRSRYATAVRAGLSPIFDPLARLYRSIAVRATRLEKMRRENRLDSELERELARSVGMTEQIEYEQEVTQEKEKILDEIDPDRVLEDPPKEKTFSVLAAVELAKEKRMDAITSEDEFFETFWPELLKKVGANYKPSTRNLGKVISVAVSDIQQWLNANPHYLDYYNTDWNLTKELLKDSFEDFSEGDFRFFRFLTGITSPSTPLDGNLVDAVGLLNEFKAEGNFDRFVMDVKVNNGKEGNRYVKSGPFKLRANTGATKIFAAKVYEQILTENDGDHGKAIDFLEAMVPVSELHAFNKRFFKGGVGSIGNIKQVVKEATGQDKLIPRMFIFGPKVGAYTLNTLGNHEYTTTDIWEGRFIRSYFPQMFADATGLPVNRGEHEIFQRFASAFNKEMEDRFGLNLEPSAYQAARWFFMIAKAKEAGYRYARTDQPISEYARRAINRVLGLSIEIPAGSGESGVDAGRGGDSTFSVIGGGGGRRPGDTGGTGENAATALRPGSPLNGAPRVEGATGPDLRIVDVARSYAQSIGIPFGRQKTYAKVDPDRATRIAQAYTDMKHDPTDPVVVEAYANLIEQTVAQYRALEQAGYTFWLYDKTNDPYPDSPYDAMRAIRANQSMGVFATEAGFGSSETASDTSENAMMVDTGIRWPYGSPDGPLKRVLANDLFRAVHDAFGHGLEGSGFRGRGEENAWQAHVKLYTGSAVGAITSETRGQNSWLNFGPYGEWNQTAKVEDTIFAEQKTGLMPEWTWTEGRVEHAVDSTFSVISAQQDSDYLSAVESGDMETVQRMVDGAARVAEWGVNFSDETNANSTRFEPTRPNGSLEEIGDAPSGLNFGPFFHGSQSRKINAFRLGRVGAIFFAENVQVARDFGPNVYPVFLKIEKLADLTDSTSIVYQDFIQAFNESGGWEWNEDAMEDRETSDFDPDIDLTQEMFDSMGFDAVRYLSEKGFDGVRLNESETETTIAVFNPNQIKSADPITYDESGNVIPLSQRFNPASDSISFSVISRDPEVTQAAKEMRDGKITPDQYQRMVDVRMPLREFESVPVPADEEDMLRGLGNRKAGETLKRDLIQNPEDIEEGTVLEARLDIPAYETQNVWVVSLHHPRNDLNKGQAGKVFAYTPTSVLRGVEFGVTEAAALNIAAGKPKSTIATMRGSYVPMTSREAYDLAVSSKEEWTEVGMNPVRHSFFYDKTTQTPVESAEMVIQVGGMVLAKNPVFGDRANYSFSVISNAESRVADSFNPYFRSPERRRKILLEAQFRSREKARDFQDIILAGKTASQLDQEQIALKKSIYDDLLIQYFGADSKKKVDALPALDRIAARDEAKRQAEQWRTMQDRQQRTIPRETLIAAMRTLDAMIVALPTEIRGKIGGMVRLATLTEPGAMVAELERRAKRLDDVLEDYLSKEADKEVAKLFKLARPAKDESGKAKVGKAGADIHDLFDMARRAWKTMSSTDAEAHAQGLEAAVGSGNLTPEEEAHKLLEAELVRSFGGWNDRYTDSGKKDKNGRPIMTKVEDGADAVRKNHALDVATDIWKRGYHDYKAKKVAEKEQRDLMRAELRIATGKSGARPERVKAEEAGLKWKGAAKEKFFSILNFEQLVTWIFGPSPSAQWFIEQQRTAENKKIDAVQDVVDGVEDLFTKLAGGRFEGEKLQYRMMQRSIKAKSATGSIEPLSEMEAISALLMWMQEDGKRHMMGLRDDTGKLTTGWSYDQNFIDEISKQMTTEGWKVLSYLIAEYRKEYDTLNPIYREIYGINMPRNANYSPLTVKPGQAKQGQTIDPTTGSTVSSGSFTPGSLRTRAQVSAEPDFRDAISTFLSHKKQIEHWKAHAVFIRDAQGVLGNRELGNSVEASSGPEAVLLLRKWLDVLAQGGARDAATGTALMRLFDRMTGRAASMALVGRAGTVMIQATQLGAASAAMPTGAYLARLSRLMTGNLGWSKALNSEYIQRRLKSAPVAVRLAMDGLRSGSPTRTKHAVREIGKILSGADALFTAGTFAIVHDYTKSQAMKAGMSESDADTFALQEAERITENLAQPTRMGTRSYFEVTTTNPIYKLAWSFGSDARKNFALLGYTMAKGTPAEKARALLFVVGVNGILSGLIRNIWRDMRDDEDEEVFDAKYWSLRRLALAASTDWLFGFPIVGEEIQGAIYSALGEQRLDSGLFSAISQAPGAFKNLVIDWDSEDVLRDVEKIVMAAGLFNDQIAAGASVLHILRDVFDLSSNIIPD